MSTLRAWMALGHNDIRGTYRDPLLIMIVAAPVIWTVGTRFVVPRLGTALEERYDFDLVPYHPLVITALLLLTSIIIAGGLAGLLVLDEVDAGTLTALRVTPLPPISLLAYRATTVIVITTVYVVATLSSCGLLRPGLTLVLLPVGAVAGLAAVVTLLLIVSIAHNKIQGIAVIRLLGIVIAGLPCLPWFVQSSWSLAFGVLPPYWAAKAFWVAWNDGTWWTYVLGGLVYNAMVGYLLLRRFVAVHS